MFSENLTLQNKRKNIFLNLMCVCIVAFSYAINSFFIKPLMVGSDGIVAFFFINYFNDLGAGVMIAAFANILFIFVRQKYVKHILFYILLWLFESLIWELFRPFVLMVFNPFDKTPHALVGDVVVYGIGTILYYLILNICNRGKKYESQKSRVL